MNRRNAQYVKLFYLVICELHIKMKNTILILTIMPETLENNQLL